MKLIIQSNRFKRDYKLAVKRRLNLGKLREIISLLANDKELPARCSPHKLKGEYFGFWECHIEPDWLLIYKFDAALLELAAMGTHADLFK
jgi:mRNA interferase YafQ